MPDPLSTKCRQQQNDQREEFIPGGSSVKNVNNITIVRQIPVSIVHGNAGLRKSFMQDFVPLCRMDLNTRYSIHTRTGWTTVGSLPLSPGVQGYFCVGSDVRRCARVCACGKGFFRHRKDRLLLWRASHGVRIRGGESVSRASASLESIRMETYTPDEITGYMGFYNKYVKRVLSFTLALALFVALIPMFVIVSLLIVLDTGFPILYKAERGGFQGRNFMIYKFRTMVKDADKMGGGTTALDDSRITRVGRFLRKIKLDETPQLINVVKGEMSFVGPRPELVKYTSEYAGVDLCILEVRPGITDYSSLEFIGLDEIVGRDNPDEMYEKHVLDKKNQLRVKYAATVSFWTDTRLFVRTVLKVLEKGSKYVLSRQG